MARTVSRHPRCSGITVCALAFAACGAEAKRPPAGDSTCADYRAALDECMSELGLAHALGPGVSRACAADALTSRDRAYFGCVTEVLDQTRCEAEALPTIRDALAVCHDTHLEDGS